MTLQDTEKLVAFTLGFVSHQVADVTWHSLGINQGFLTTIGGMLISLDHFLLHTALVIQEETWLHHLRVIRGNYLQD